MAIKDGSMKFWTSSARLRPTSNRRTIREEITAAAATADAPLVMGEPVRVISLTPDSEAARAVPMGQTGIVADISGIEVLVDFAENQFLFDRDQIARVSTARSPAPAEANHHPGTEKQPPRR